MITNANDGGPAYPLAYSFAPEGQLVVTTPGMSLRDYFAASAMQGMLTNDSSGTTSAYAERAYKHADAMLRAREAKSDG